MHVAFPFSWILTKSPVIDWQHVDTDHGLMGLLTR